MQQLSGPLTLREFIDWTREILQHSKWHYRFNVVVDIDIALSMAGNQREPANMDELCGLVHARRQGRSYTDHVQCIWLDFEGVRKLFARTRGGANDK